MSEEIALKSTKQHKKLKAKNIYGIKVQKFCLNF